MTMTVRCTHCEQVMAIAPRKPGSRVTCPACGRSVTVPAAGAGEPAPATPQHAGATGHAAAPRPAAAPAVGAHGRSPAVIGAAVAVGPAAVVAATPARSEPAPSAGPEDLDVRLPSTNHPTRPAPAHWVALPPVVLVLALLFALAALALAFFAGFLFGKHG